MDRSFELQTSCFYEWIGASSCKPRVFTNGSGLRAANRSTTLCDPLRLQFLKGSAAKAAAYKSARPKGKRRVKLHLRYLQITEDNGDRFFRRPPAPTASPTVALLPLTSDFPLILLQILWILYQFSSEFVDVVACFADVVSNLLRFCRILQKSLRFAAYSAESAVFAKKF